MRVLVCAVPLLALVLTTAGHAFGQNQTRELIAVIDMQPVGATAVEASALTDRLREELLRTGQFTLVDRSQMENVLNEQALQQAGCTEQECAVQVGRILGVRKIVAGKVTKISDNIWQLSAIMVDVETSETIRAESVQHRGDFFALLTSQVPPLAAKLATQNGGAAVAVPAPAPPPVEPASMEPGEPDKRPKWMLYTGWGLVGVGLLNQVAARTTNDDAQALAEEARTENSTTKYTEAEDLRADAESKQSAAFLLTAGGLGVLYYYYFYLPAHSDNTAQAESPESIHVPLRVATLGNGAQVGWAWRW